MIYGKIKFLLGWILAVFSFADAEIAIPMVIDAENLFSKVMEQLKPAICQDGA
jgi:hypothetical protein